MAVRSTFAYTSPVAARIDEARGACPFSPCVVPRKNKQIESEPYARQNVWFKIIARKSNWFLRTARRFCFAIWTCTDFTSNERDKLAERTSEKKTKKNNGIHWLLSDFHRLGSRMRGYDKRSGYVLASEISGWDQESYYDSPMLVNIGRLKSTFRVVYR